MKKLSTIIAVFITIMLCLSFVACNHVVPDKTNVSVTDAANTPGADGGLTDAVSQTDISKEDSKNISGSDESKTFDNCSISAHNDEKYVWYTEDKLAEWFDTMIKAYKNAPESPDNKHTYEYFCLDGILSSYIGVERINKEATKFAGTEDYNVRAICEYFGIDKKTYTDLYDSYFDRLSAAKYGEMPDIFMFAYGYQYDAWFDGDYWDNELFLAEGYKAPEYDTYRGEVPEGDNHTRRYYTVDWRLIEYVGTEKFEAWLADNPEASDRNIIKFISDFGITREQYVKIYDIARNGKAGSTIVLPYKTDYLFGTEEMITEYFTVHPLG